MLLITIPSRGWKPSNPAFCTSMINVINHNPLTGMETLQYLLALAHLTLHLVINHNPLTGMETLCDLYEHNSVITLLITIPSRGWKPNGKLAVTPFKYPVINHNPLTGMETIESILQTSLLVLLITIPSRGWKLVYDRHTIRVHPLLLITIPSRGWKLSKGR